MRVGDSCDCSQLGHTASNKSWEPPLHCPRQSGPAACDVLRRSQLWLSGVPVSLSLHLCFSDRPREVTCQSRASESLHFQLQKNRNAHR